MSDERKTLEQREQMTDIERLRHSASHVLAPAILKIWPEAQFAAGPPVEDGFYYDVDLPHRISPDDFANIEAETKKIRSSSGFTVLRSRTRRSSTNTSRCWRKRRSAITASSDENWKCSSSM